MKVALLHFFGEREKVAEVAIGRVLKDARHHFRSKAGDHRVAGYRPNARQGRRGRVLLR